MINYKNCYFYKILSDIFCYILHIHFAIIFLLYKYLIFLVAYQSLSVPNPAYKNYGLCCSYPKTAAQTVERLRLFILFHSVHQPAFPPPRSDFSCRLKKYRRGKRTSPPVLVCILFYFSYRWFGISHAMWSVWSRCSARSLRGAPRYCSYRA